MASKVQMPELPSLPMQENIEKRSRLINRLTQDLPKTSAKCLKKTDHLGRGSYGTVDLYSRDGKSIVMKEMLDNNEDRKIRLFFKEAKLLESMNHPNIVRFDSIYDDAEDPKTAFLMEYVHFSFAPFKVNKIVSSLKDFLSVLDVYNCEGLEFFATVIAKDTANGLAYLHSKNIVHRDLKPDNVLVSNSHYSALANQEAKIVWAAEPIRVKLTDFGESRAELIQTYTLVHENTINLNRGAPAYMAPELLLSSRGQSLNIDGLKKCDMWSYAMILFNIMNPNLKHPFDLEIRDKQNPEDILRLEKLPNQGTKYAALKLTEWSKVNEVYNRCAKFEDRPTAQEVVSYFDDTQEKDRNNTDSSPHARIEYLKAEHRVEINPASSNKVITTKDVSALLLKAAGEKIPDHWDKKTDGIPSVVLMGSEEYKKKMSGVSKRGRMSEEGRSIIQENFNFLIHEILPEDVASELYSRFILTQEDFERINAEEKQSGHIAAAKKLLSILEYCGNNSYNEFLEALKNTGFSAAVTKLQQTVVRPSEDPFAWLQNLSSEKSQMPLKENHLSGLAGYFAQNWEAVSFKLGCTQAQISQAILNNPSSVFMQIFTTLNKWKQKNASQATLIELLNAMKDCSHTTIIDWVGVKKYVDEL